MVMNEQELSNEHILNDIHDTLKELVEIMKTSQFNLNEKEFWTLEETAAYLGLAESTLNHKNKRIIIPGLHKPDTQYYYNAKKVKQWIREKKITNVEEFLANQDARINNGGWKRPRGIE